jgi:hypothetical protein
MTSITISFLLLLQASILVTSFSPSYHWATVRLQKLTFSLRGSSTSPVREEVAGDFQNSKLYQFLADASAVGAVRFVVVGTGAILETIGCFDNMRFSDTVKGKLITFSSENPCFECHVRVAEVKEVKNIVVEKFEKKLRITRFLGKYIRALDF